MPTSIESQGVVIKYSDGGSPSSFSNIGNVVSFSGPGGSASVIDVSNLDSPFREKRMGLPDEGQFTLELNLDPDNTSHLALKTARAARTRLEFRITLTDSTATNIGFFGYVLNYQLAGGVDQIVKASITIEIDGATFWV